MDLKSDLEKRIKRRDDLKGKHDQLLGRKEQLEREYLLLCEDCKQLGISPELLNETIQQLAEEIKVDLQNMDKSLDSLEGELSKF